MQNVVAVIISADFYEDFKNSSKLKKKVFSSHCSELVRTKSLRWQLHRSPNPIDFVRVASSLASEMGAGLNCDNVSAAVEEE